MGKETGYTGYCTCPIEHWQDVPNKGARCWVCGLPSYSDWLDRKRDQYSMVGRKWDE